MLQLRPTCEHCNTKLPAHSNQAFICSFECTFCLSCIEDFIGLVCPNCGGELIKRPIRPAQNRKNGNCLLYYPASKKIVHKPKNKPAHLQFRKQMQVIAPEFR